MYNQNSNERFSIQKVAEAYQQYGYYVKQYTSECIYSIISDLAGNLIDVDLENWISDVPVNFNLFSALVGGKGTGKSTTIKKFKYDIYRKVISRLKQIFNSEVIDNALNTKDLDIFQPSAEGIAKELNEATQRVVRFIGIEFSKTMSQMYGSSYLSSLPMIFNKLHDGDEINRWLSGSANIHVEGGKFTTMILDLHPQDLNSKEYIEGGLGRRTNLAIYNGKLEIPKMTVEESQKNRKMVKELDDDLVNFIVNRFRHFIRVDEKQPKPKLSFTNEALQIFLDLSQMYGTDSNVSIMRYPTVVKYAMLEAILNPPNANTIEVNKDDVKIALAHLYQYETEQKELTQHIEMSLPEGRVNAVIDYVNKYSYEKDGGIHFVPHKELLQNLNLTAEQTKMVETQIAQSRKCWVISYKLSKKKPSKILARGDIPERVLKTFLDSEMVKYAWERYEIESDA